MALFVKYCYPSKNMAHFLILRESRMSEDTGKTPI